jgi:hypothetical protein
MAIAAAMPDRLSMTGGLLQLAGGLQASGT